MITEHCEIRLKEDDCLKDALQLLRENKLQYACVFSHEGIPVGILKYPDAAVKKMDDETLGNTTVGAVMDRNFTVITDKTNLEEFVNEDIENKTFPMVFIDDNGRYQAMLTEQTLIKILHKNLKYIYSILDNIDDGIIAIDEYKNIAYTNESWRHIHSVDNEAFLGTNVIELFPESKIEKKGKSGSEAEMPIHFKLTGATVVPCYKPIMDNSDNNLGTMAIVKDYNSINNFYIGINKNNEVNGLFSSIFENLQEAIFVVDKNYEIIYTNRAFKKQIDLNIGETLPDCSIKRLIREKYKLSKVDSFNAEVNIETKSEYKNKVCSFIPVYDVHKALNGMVMILKEDAKIANYIMRGRKKTLLDYYQSQINKIPDEMICESENFKVIVSMALKVSVTDASVLIEGENGVGKEMIAKLIHNNSNRALKPFVPVNCGAIPETLWESEMFGYEEGAFTGAKKGGKPGHFELAERGTIFLDEIGEMPLEMQVKLLRVLQNMEVARVGGKGARKIDVRVIAATNKKLKELVLSKEFREDLYYRLNVINLPIPPLRDRVNEIRPLTEKFLGIFSKQYGKNVKISDEAVNLLEKERWPGNIRQLHNVIEQSVIMCDNVIMPYDLPIENNDQLERRSSDSEIKYPPGDKWNLPLRLQLLEKTIIKEALEKSDYNKSKAINMLNISRKTFYKKLKEYEME